MAMQKYHPAAYVLDYNICMLYLSLSKGHIYN